MTVHFRSVPNVTSKWELDLPISKVQAHMAKELSDKLIIKIGFCELFAFEGFYVDGI